LGEKRRNDNFGVGGGRSASMTKGASIKGRWKKPFLRKSGGKLCGRGGGEEKTGKKSMGENRRRGVKDRS